MKKLEDLSIYLLNEVIRKIIMKEYFKVLHIITLSEIGGAQQVCLNIVTNLEKARYIVEVSCVLGGN